MPDVRDQRGRVRAAGGVLWREGAGGRLEVALVHRPRYDDWSLPKGKLDPGEHDLTAAAREVVEETGCLPRLGRPLGDVTYAVDDGEKLVRWWSAEQVGGRFVPNDEVDRLDWVPVPDAEQRLTHADDAHLLARLTSRPYATVPLVLVRHGHAGSKRAWRADDRLRPLSSRGRRDALRLVDPLQAFRPDRVVSADLVRCTATVQPLASALGLPVELDRALDETTNADTAEPARTALRALLRSGRPTVVCSQGGVIPEVLREIAAEDGVRLPVDRKPRKGSAWVLHAADGRVVETEYFRDLAPQVEAEPAVLTTPAG